MKKGVGTSLKQPLKKKSLQVAFKLPKSAVWQVDECVARTERCRSSLLRTAVRGCLEHATGRPAVLSAVRESIDVVHLHYPAMATTDSLLCGTAGNLPASFVVDGSAGYSLCGDSVGGAVEASGCDTAMDIFMLFRASGNKSTRIAKGAVARTAVRCPSVAGRAARPFHWLSRGCWLSLPGEIAKQELFNSGRSPP